MSGTRVVHQGFSLLGIASFLFANCCSWPRMCGTWLLGLMFSCETSSSYALSFHIKKTISGFKDMKTDLVFCTFESDVDQVTSS